jgi:hypothetical protein
MTHKIFDNTKQQFIDGEWDRWQDALEHMIDTDPQLKYIHREEMEDIVLSRFTNFDGEGYTLVDMEKFDD